MSTSRSVFNFPVYWICHDAFMEGMRILDLETSVSVGGEAVHVSIAGNVDESVACVGAQDAMNGISIKMIRFIIYL